MANPTKFSDLSKDELIRSATEDFAVEVDSSMKKDEVITAIVESDVKWSDYVAQHPDVATDAPSPDAPESPVQEEVEVVTAPSPEVKQQYLIKMTRANPLFQTCGYTFTEKHPYALVDAQHVDYILTKEDGFRQATPNELEEFYS